MESTTSLTGVLTVLVALILLSAECDSSGDRVTSETSTRVVSSSQGTVEVDGTGSRAVFEDTRSSVVECADSIDQDNMRDPIPAENPRAEFSVDLGKISGGEDAAGFVFESAGATAPVRTAESNELSSSAEDRRLLLLRTVVAAKREATEAGAVDEEHQTYDEASGWEADGSATRKAPATAVRSPDSERKLQRSRQELVRRLRAERSTGSVAAATSVKDDSMRPKHGLRARHRVDPQLQTGGVFKFDHTGEVEILTDFETLKAELVSRNWTENKVAGSDEYDLIWTRWNLHSAHVSSPLQLVNVITNHWDMSLKQSMLRNIENLGSETWAEFFPRAYDFSTTSGVAHFLKCELPEHEVDIRLESRLKASGSPKVCVGRQAFESQNASGDDIFILKPPSGALGKGIILARVDDVLKKSGVLSLSQHNYVVQRYIEDILVVHDRKVDIRLHALITSLKPMRFYIFKRYYARYCNTPYSLDDLSDLYAHVSNEYVQRRRKAFDSKFALLSMEELEDVIRERHGASRADSLFDRMADTVSRTLSMWPVRGHRDRSFHLVGVDILLDASGRPWMCEINANPSSKKTRNVTTQYHAELQRSLVDGSWLGVASSKTVLFSEFTVGGPPKPEGLEAWLGPIEV